MTWKIDKRAITAIKNVENRKDTKYMDKILEKYSEDDESQPSAERINKHEEYGKVQSATISLEFLERLFILAKGSKANQIDLYISEDKPLKAKFFSKETSSPSIREPAETEVGTMIIAPLKHAKERRQQEKTLYAL